MAVDAAARLDPIVQARNINGWHLQVLLDKEDGVTDGKSKLELARLHEEVKTHLNIWSDDDWIKFDGAIAKGYPSSVKSFHQRIFAAKKGFGQVHINQNYDFSGFQQSNLFKPSATMRVPKGTEWFEAFEEWYIVETSIAFSGVDDKYTPGKKHTKLCDLKAYLATRECAKGVWVRLKRNPPANEWFASKQEKKDTVRSSRYPLRRQNFFTKKIGLKTFKWLQNLFNLLF